VSLLQTRQTLTLDSGSSSSGEPSESVLLISHHRGTLPLTQ